MEVAELPIIAVCNLTSTVAVPALPSHAVRCSLCRATVWLPRATIAAIVRMGHDQVVVLCTLCAPHFAGSVQAVLTTDGLTPDQAGERSRKLGVAAGTPVINLDRVPRA